MFCFFFSSRRRHTRWTGDWSSDVCSSDLVEAARKLAERMMSEAGPAPETRIDFAFRLATARTPNAREREVLLALRAKQLAIYQRDRNRALDLLKIGESGRNETL